MAAKETGQLMILNDLVYFDQRSVSIYIQRSNQTEK